MRNEFLELLNFITRHLILDESFLDVCLVNKINPDSWPECLPKQVAIEYIKQRQKHDHSFAAVQVSGNLSDLDGSEDFPSDLKILRAYYEITYRKYSVKVLAQGLLANPDDAEKLIANFQVPSSQEEIVSLAEVFESVVHDSVRLADSGEALRLLPGWPILSDTIGGFNPGRVGLMMAATGFGKTTLAVNFTMASAQKHSAVYFNMEMILQDFAEKIIMAGSGVDFKTYKREVNTRAVQAKIGDFYSSIIGKKFYFSRGRSLSPQEIFSICRRHQKVHGLDFVVVDYDQKLILNTDKNIPEWKAIQVAVEQFEVLAKELNCYILILAQEGEEGEIGGSKRSKFPASTVLRFYEDDGKFLIAAVKNRFGKRAAKVEVEYVAEKGSVSEVGEYKPAEKVSEAFKPRGQGTDSNQASVHGMGQGRPRGKGPFGTYNPSD